MVYKVAKNLTCKKPIPIPHLKKNISKLPKNMIREQVFALTTWHYLYRDPINCGFAQRIAAVPTKNAKNILFCHENLPILKLQYVHYQKVRTGHKNGTFTVVKAVLELLFYKKYFPQKCPLTIFFYQKRLKICIVWSIKY